MLTDNDIKKIISVVATKEDLGALREIVRGLAVSVDKFVGITDDLKQEYIVMSA